MLPVPTLFLVWLASSAHGADLPHIIYILADDMGWNDVSFHGSNQIPTPNLDSLAYHGVILNKHYTQAVCTPSRASLMTGKYPIHTGLHSAILASHKVGLSLNEKIMPEYFKEIGYATHIVGKWHLGFHKQEFTPVERGFDSHFGYWSGAISYYDHINLDLLPIPPNKYLYSGHDMRRNLSSAWDVVGQYATDVFTSEAVDVINHHPPDKPLFLYLSHLAVHAGNTGKWLEAPQEEINRFSYISNPNRRSYAAMVSKLDQSVGLVVEALHRNAMLQNSIIVFVSDNGAPTIGVYNNWGSNYPWRGQKQSLWEGGVRTPALVWSPLIAKPSRVSTGLMHISDWLPTLLAAAGCDVKSLHIDGVNQWQSITRGIPSSREGLVVDIFEEKSMSSIILNNFKYIHGPLTPGLDSVENTFLSIDTIISPKQPKYNSEEVSQSLTWKILENYSRDPNLITKIKYIRQEATVVCKHDFDKVLNCTDEPCLFNLQTDPCEQNNIAKLFPTFINYIQHIISALKKGTVPSLPLYQDPASNPEFFNVTWSIWDG